MESMNEMDVSITARAHEDQVDIVATGNALEQVGLAVAIVASTARQAGIKLETIAQIIATAEELEQIIESVDIHIPLGGERSDR